MLFKDVVPCTCVTRLIAWDAVLGTPSVLHVWVRGSFRKGGQRVHASSSSDTPGGIAAQRERREVCHAGGLQPSSSVLVPPTTSNCPSAALKDERKNEVRWLPHLVCWDYAWGAASFIILSWHHVCLLMLQRCFKFAISKFHKWDSPSCHTLVVVMTSHSCSPGRLQILVFFYFSFKDGIWWLELFGFAPQCTE